MKTGRKCRQGKTWLFGLRSNDERGGKEEWGNNKSTHPTFYMPERQTRINKRTNKDKRDHLIDLSLFYHMRRKNNRTASMRSHAAMHSHPFITWKERTIERTQCAAARSNAQSFFYHMGEENNRTASMCSRTQQCTVITCKVGLRQPIRLMDKVVS